MITVTKKEECCGCTACASICPQECISMKVDEEGFMYPSVNQGKCVNCHICEKVCPIANNDKLNCVTAATIDIKEITENAIEKEKILPDCYAAFLKDNNARNDSTSGGVFTALAEYVLQQHGKVYGVEIAKDNRVVHSCVENMKYLGKYRHSKYVQSDQNGIFKRIKSDLESGRWVLYSGTPCQVAGLLAFLQKNYAALITVDVFCHGVGSPKYWQKYTQYMEKEYSSKIEKVVFREKTYGYNSACLAVYFNNGKSSHKGHDDDYYWSVFSKCLIFRPSCYSCPFKRILHKSDFSIGDYWDNKELGPEFENANGCSLLLVHTEKGKAILKRLTDIIVSEKVELEKALVINGSHQPSMLISSSVLPKGRETIFSDIDTMSMSQLFSKYTPLGKKKQLMCRIKPFLFKLGVLEFAKKIKR